MRTIQSLTMLAAAGVLAHTASGFLQPAPGTSALGRYALTAWAVDCWLIDRVDHCRLTLDDRLTSPAPPIQGDPRGEGRRAQRRHHL